jgi:hypothetical protein
MSVGKIARSQSYSSTLSSISVHSSASQAVHDFNYPTTTADSDLDDSMSTRTSTSTSTSTSNAFRFKTATPEELMTVLNQSCGCKDDKGSCLSDIPGALQVLQSTWSGLQCMRQPEFKRHIVQAMVLCSIRDPDTKEVTFSFRCNGHTLCSQSWCMLHQVKSRTFREWKRNMLDVYKANPDLAAGAWCTAWDTMCKHGGGRVSTIESVKESVSMSISAWMRRMFEFLDKSPEDSQRLYLDIPSKKELYEQWLKAQQLSATPEIASKSSFMKVWQTEFPNVKLRKVTSQHKCDICSRFLERTSTSTSNERLAAVQKEWRAHLQLQDKERRVYYKHKDKARNFPSKYLSIIADGMDQKKTCLPRSRANPKLLGPENQVQFKLQGVLVHNHGMFTYIIPPWVHGTANLVISTLHRTLQQLEYIPPVLYLQLDGASQNKCDTMMAYCDWLVSTEIFRKVKLSFLHVGHTHEDIDQQFSVVARFLKRKSVWTPHQLFECVECALKPSKYHEDNNLLPSTLVSWHHVNWDVSRWLAPHIDSRLANYRRDCHVFRLALHSDRKVYMHYKLRASLKDWYPSLKPDANAPPLRYTEGKRKGAVIAGTGIRVLISKPATDAPTQMDAWNSAFSNHYNVEQLLDVLLHKVMPDIVPEEVRNAFQSCWEDFLQVDLQQQSLQVTAEHCWKPAGKFVPAFHHVGAAAAVMAEESDMSSGILVEPVTHSGYVLSQRARAAIAKDRRKQSRTNISLEPGMILAVAKVLVLVYCAPMPCKSHA